MGTIVGQKLPIQQYDGNDHTIETTEKSTQQQEKQLRDVSLKELQEHNTRDDCWVSIHGIVYDLTDFVDEHPAGAESIYELAGKDGTNAFAAVHNQGLLDDFDDVQIGKFVESIAEEEEQEDDHSSATSSGSRENDGGRMHMPSSSTEKGVIEQQQQQQHEPSSSLSLEENKNDDQEEENKKTTATMMPTAMPTTSDDQQRTSSPSTSQPPVAARISSLARSIFQ